jgi:hypothetical protein
MRPTLIELLPIEQLKTLKLGIPELAAWCLWEKILVGKGAAASPKASVYELAVDLSGHLLGAPPLLTAIGGRIATAQGCRYKANIGWLALTPTELIFIDCDCIVAVLNSGVEESQIDKVLEFARDRRLKLTLWRAGREKLHASLRQQGAMLVLRGLGPKVRHLEFARLDGDHDPRAFVHAIMNVPELPDVDNFIRQAQRGSPDAALLDAMALDSLHTEEIFQRLERLDRDALAVVLGNVSASRSSAFALLLEAWLAQRAQRAKSYRACFWLSPPLGILCAVRAILLSKDAPAMETARMVAIFCAVLLFVASIIFWISAARAEWFAVQLERFRSAQSLRQRR